MEKTVRKNFLRIKHFILITIVALFFTAFSGFSIIAQSGGFENKTVFGSEISLPEGVDSWADVYISSGSSIMGIKSEYAHLTELYIPEKINNVSITEIASKAFSENNTLLRVDMPYITEIGSSAFQSCTNLTDVNIPEVTSIGSSAFRYCYSLIEIDLPNVTSVGNFAFGSSNLTEVILPKATTIGTNAFQSCSNLTEVNIPEVTSIGSSAFRYCYSLMKITIPSSVTSIGKNAFYGCYQLVQIRKDSNQDLKGLPANLGQEILTSEEVFANTLSTQDGVTLFTVTSVEGDDEVYLIDGGNSAVLDLSDKTFDGVYNYAFKGNKTLTQITLPDSCTSIGLYAFDECANLTKINLPNVTSVGNYVFRNCKNLIETSLPNVTSVGNDAFGYCSNLTEVNIPKATSIGTYAFRDCYSLMKITIPSSVNSIGNTAFSGCYKLVQIRNYSNQNLKLKGLPANLGQAILTSEEGNFANTLSTTQDGVTLFTVTNEDEGNEVYLIDGGNSAVLDLSLETIKGVYNYAFYGNETLTQITLPDGCTSVGDGAFYECANLTEIDLPEATTIGEDAFRSCTSLTEVILPKATEIEVRAFYDCTSLMSLSLPSLTSVGSSTFSGLSSLIGLDLSSVTTLESGAFSTCSKLIEINLPILETLPEYAFLGNFPDMTEINLPSVKNVPDATFRGYVPNLTKINLPEATTIGQQAFYNCTKLNEVILPKATEIGWMAFNGCSSLTEISLPEVTTIGEHAFEDCTNLTEVNIPKATEIGVRAFLDCTSLIEVNSPQVTTLKEMAFSGCSSLTRVNSEKDGVLEIPASIASIGDRAFEDCSKIVDVYIPIEFAGFGSSFFNGVFNNEDIKLRVFGRKAIDSREEILTYTAGLNGGLHYFLYVHAQDRAEYDSSGFYSDTNCTICSDSYVVKFFNDSEEIKTITIEDALPKLSENDFPELEINDGYYNDEGWYTDTDLTQQYDLDTELTDNLNLYTGIFATTYNIVYSNNLNEAGLEYNNQTTYTIEDTPLTLEDPESITGYTFTGWFLNKGVDDYEEITKVEGLTRDLEIEARYELTVYSISYTSDKELITVEHSNPESYRMGDDVTLTNPSAVVGYTFTGWFLNDEPITDIENRTGNLEIEARFSADIYSITYTNNLDGEGVTYNNPTEYTIADKITLTNPSEITGYTFTGWFLDELQITEVEGLTGDLAIEARFSADSYSITYTNSLGKEDITYNNPTTYTIADKITLTNPSEMAGCEFINWSLKISETENETISKIENRVGNLVIQAQYKVIVYTIVYEVEGEVSESSYTILDEDIVLEPAQKLGNDFLGWRDAATGEYVTVVNSSLARDVTLVAEFQINKYVLWTYIGGAVLLVVAFALMLTYNVLLKKRRRVIIKKPSIGTSGEAVTAKHTKKENDKKD